MVAFKSLAGKTVCKKPMFEQDEINLKIMMNFLLSAKLMNKVLLTSPVLNSYSQGVYFPGSIKRLNIRLGIRLTFLKSAMRFRNQRIFFLFCKQQG